jgi:DNA end-binding protein Ku
MSLTPSPSIATNPIDERYLKALTPKDDVGQEAFAVIRDAMRGKEIVALARIVMPKRKHVVIMIPGRNAGLEERYLFSKELYF